MIGSKFLPMLGLILLCACSSDSTQVIGDRHPAISPDSVVVNPLVIDDYELIATIKVTSNAGWDIYDCHRRALTRLKKRAAALGANALVMMPLGDRSTSAPAPNTLGGASTVPFLGKGQTILAKAIYVPNTEKAKNGLVGFLQILPAYEAATPSF